MVNKLGSKKYQVYIKRNLWTAGFIYFFFGLYFASVLKLGIERMEIEIGHWLQVLQ